MVIASNCYDFPLLKDEVTTIVQDAVLSSLEGKAYEHAKVYIYLFSNLFIYKLQEI